MGRRLRSLIRKEFIQILRDRRTLAMMIVVPLIWLTVFGYAATFDVRHIPLGLINQSTSTPATRLVAAVKDDPTFQTNETVLSRDDLTAKLREGRLGLGLIIPREFGQNPGPGQEPAQVQVLVDGSDFFSAQAGLRALSPALQRAAGERGAVSKVEILYNPDLKSANVMIPGLTGMVILFITTIMTALGIVREKEQGTLEQIIVSPITPLELILGKLIPYTLIGLLDFALVVSAGIFLFQIPFTGNLPVFAGLAALFLLSTLGLGLLVSTLAQNQQQAIQMAIFMVFPQFLLSGFVFPLNAMPLAIRYVAYFFPLTYYMPIARGMFLKSATIDMLYEPAILLAVYGIAMITFAAARFRKRLG
ncbi:MAG TPA: ABC transporter permease [Symbiobacteriaceae bacterium]